nr:RHS repeat-associated core domain-containing protein [Armatimonas sp.]
MSVFLLLVCSQSSLAQTRYLCQYDAADNLLLSAPAAGGLQGLSPIVHDAPSGKVLRAGDKAFTYDAWGRVKTVSLVNGSGGGGGDEPPVGGGGGGNNTLLVSYEYDALGRRFSATSANDVRYFDWANRLTSMTSGSGTLTADHDANGNMTRLGSDYLGWNVRGQLASMTSGGQSSTFGYDLYNRRISKSVSGNSPRSYKWSGWRSHGGTGSGVFAKTTGVDNHASLGGNATITDHLGSVVTLLNNAGAPAQQNSFDPFGQTISSTNSNGFGGQNYGFTGLEHDESGLVYARNRYYSPGLGRFISEDPIGFGGGSNFYAYCGNDPINFTDPLGLSRVNIPGFGEFEFDTETVGNGLATGTHGLASGMTLGLYDGGSYRCELGFNEAFVGGAVATGAMGGMAATAEGAAFAYSAYSAGARMGAGLGARFGASAAGRALGAAGAALGLRRGGCFVAGTAVTLGNGEHVAIETVKKGDTLQARDADTGKLEARVVNRTSKVTSYELVTIEIADAASGKVVDTITGTPNHPFYVPSKGWVPLGQLGIGTSLVTRAGPSGGFLVVKSNRRESRPEGVSVYNFEVDGFHTYFVGTTNGGIWVHNGPPCPKLSDPLPNNLGSKRLEPIRNAYEDIKLGRGTPRTNPNGSQKTFGAGELRRNGRGRNVWEGSKEWDVPGTDHRILERQDGRLGYVIEHDYANPRLFPSPWYPDGG